MSHIALNVYSRNISISNGRDSNKRCLQFDALIGKDYDSHKRELQTGGQLSDLTGRLFVYGREESDIKDDDSQDDELKGSLAYVAEDKEYNIEECFEAFLSLSSQEFSNIECWILNGKTKAVVVLGLLGPGIGEGPAPDISSDPRWMNKDHSSLPIESCKFIFRPDNYEIGNITEYIEPNDAFGFIPNFSDSWSLGDWEYSLPAKYRNEIKKQSIEKFGDPKDPKNKFPRDLEDRRTWSTYDLSFTIGHRVATYQLEHPTDDNTYDFKYRLKTSFNYLLKLIDDLHNCDRQNHDRLHDVEKNYNWKCWVWRHLNPSVALKEGKSSRDYWYVYPDAINPYCISYLNKPWMECPALECALTDALIYTNTLEFGETLKVRKNFGWIGKLIRFSVSIFSGFLVYTGTSDNIGFGLFAGLITWIAFKIYESLSPKRKKLADMDGLLHEMIDICNYFNTPHIRPEYIKQRLLATASKGAIWSTGVIALVEHAARRNPEIWWTDYEETDYLEVICMTDFQID